MAILSSIPMNEKKHYVKFMWSPLSNADPHPLINDDSHSYLVGLT